MINLVTQSKIADVTNYHTLKMAINYSDNVMQTMLPSRRKV